MALGWGLRMRLIAIIRLWFHCLATAHRPAFLRAWDTGEIALGAPWIVKHYCRDCGKEFFVGGRMTDSRYRAS